MSFTIHVTPEYTWKKYKTLFVKPRGSVTINGINERERMAAWWPINWVALIVFFPLIICLYIKGKGEKL